MALIDRNAALEICQKEYDERIKMHDWCGDTVAWNIGNELKSLPTVDAVVVTRCKNCEYYHKPHVLCNDGTEKDFSAFPAEAFGPLSIGVGVTAAYGINVSGKCERDNDSGYSCDKSVCRNETDFCSRGEPKREEEEAK